MNTGTVLNIVAGVLVHALAPPFAGDAAAIGEDVGGAAVGDGVEVDVAVVADIFEMGFLDNDIVKRHLLAGNAITLGLTVEVLVILVVFFIVDQA